VAAESARDISRPFDRGDPVLDQWLKRFALTNHRSGAARVFVSALDGDRVVGYRNCSQCIGL
jgi:hypothetical protein